ncbi:outer membrane lipoprotein-sorting protein [candidate division KSB1 bacterium]|nr:outer membrane lipoprotein-sorting protein [candidate division KSB1 bacterium]
MSRIAVCTVIFSLLITAAPVAQELTALEILKKADAVANEPEDQDIKLKMILIDKDGLEKEREMIMLQKGTQKRRVKFLSPADVKGLAFLGLPDDVMYLYLPAFKKVRRIASHVKNTSFAGTDFTYDDMGSINFADDYDPILLEKSEDFYVLRLTPKAGVKKDYGWLKMWVGGDNFYPVKIEFYDKDEKLWKVMERKRIEKIDGHWTAREVVMRDLKKRHRTEMVIQEVKFDTGLKDELFTQRYLKR